MARRTWTSAAGSANMEVSSAGKANREAELSCKTCLKRTLERAPTFATPNFHMEFGRAGRRRPEQAVELYERKAELCLQQTLLHFHIKRVLPHLGEL
jgi:hypothetical protein